MASIIKVNTIQDATNSNTAMSVASDGRTTFTTQPQITTPIAFHAAQENSTGAGVQGTINFSTVFVNLGSAFDGSNGRFTAPIAGTYFFHLHAFGCGNTGGSTVGSGSTLAGRFQKNGSDFTGASKMYNLINATSYPNVSCSQIVTLAQNDYITFYVSDSYFYVDTTPYPTLVGKLIG